MSRLHETRLKYQTQSRRNIFIGVEFGDSDENIPKRVTNVNGSPDATFLEQPTHSGLLCLLVDPNFR
jgi:hypothetical protein